MRAVQKWWTQPEFAQVIYLLIGGLLLRGTVAIWLPPGFDEAYYYLYTPNLNWSYFDHPLMVALTTGFGPWLTGEVSQFTIRLAALLLYTGALAFLYLTSARLFSTRAAVLTLAIASIVPIFQFGFGILTLPDSPLMFFWSAALYVAAEEFFPASEEYHPSDRLALIGLLVGLACLSKYHGLALGFGLVGFCLTSPRHRVALLSPWMLAAGALFLLAIAPIVIWNAQHGWISFYYQSGRAIPDRGYSLIALLETFLLGVVYLFPTFGFPLWWVSVRAVAGQMGRGRGGEGEVKEDAETRRHGDAENVQSAICNLQSAISTSNLKIRFIVWLSLPLMLGFTLMGGYRPILPTWPMPGFWGAVLLLGDRAAHWPTCWVRRWLWGSGLAIATLLLIALLHLTLGTLQKSSRYAWFGGVLPASADASVQLVDIQQIRRGFAASPVLTFALQQTDFVFTSEIFLAGYVDMAIAPFNPPPMTSFSDDLRGLAFWSTADQWVGKDGLYITSSRLPNADPYKPYFQQIQKIGEFSLQRGETIVETIQVYQCQTLLKPYPRPYGNGTQQWNRSDHF
ncbi:MAG: glycosyltransferase family 39 protein [Leptolyngbyaceae cyanobacterium RU_5_1]|nr:glycosyltransferase family 39 protein [Leptolyngbyaceae cyanobacterium RU_5_1]